MEFGAYFHWYFLPNSWILNVFLTPIIGHHPQLVLPPPPPPQALPQPHFPRHSVDSEEVPVPPPYFVPNLRVLVRVQVRRLHLKNLFDVKSDVRGVSGGPSIGPPWCRETSVSRTANVGTAGTERESFFNCIAFEVSHFIYFITSKAIELYL